MVRKMMSRPAFGKTEAAVILILLCFVVVRSFYSVPTFSDENIYINMAKAVNNGLVPYHDFFYAHPPLQLYLFQPVLSVFGENFFAVKAFMTLISSLCALFVFLIVRRMFGEKAAVAALVLFILFPGFIIFSNQATGMLEALSFFLAGFYLLLRKNTFLSSIFFCLAIFTRYLYILMIPMILLFIWEFDRGLMKRLVAYLAADVAIIASFFVAIFGPAMLRDTVIYHFQANISVKAGIAMWISQYLVFGFFTIFISAICIAYGVWKKDRLILLLAAYPLAYDLLVLLIFKAVIYHYFLASVAFIFIAAGGVASKSGNLMRISIAIIALTALVTNAQGILLYSMPSQNQAFTELANYARENVSSGEFIFGEPRTTDYVSFATGARIAGNNFDTDSKAVNFAGEDRFFANVTAFKPEMLLIDGNFNYLDRFGRSYIFVKEWNVPGYMDVSLYRRAPDNVSAFMNLSA